MPKYLYILIFIFLNIIIENFLRSQIFLWKIGKIFIGLNIRKEININI